MRRRLDLRLLAPACAAWVAGWVAVAAPDLGLSGWLPAIVAWAASGALAAALGAILLRRARRGSRRGPSADAPPPWPGLVPALAGALLAAAAAALVAHAAGAASGVREASPLCAAAASGAEVEVVVELTSAPRVLRVSAAAPWAAAEGPRVRYRAELVAVDGAPASRVAVSVTGAAADGFVFGARAGFRARVDSAPAAEAASFRLRPAGDVATTPPSGVVGWAAGLRSGFADAATQLGGDGGALVPGLAIGDTSAVGERLDADMKTSSLTHLTAVSGANCAVITALVLALAAACGAPRTVRIVAALVALGGFVLLVTPESSVVRAAAMAVVVLIATISGRPGGGVAALSLAVIVLLTADPWYARDYGFALSVCATAGLLLLAAPLAARMARVMPRPLAMALAVPSAAQLACQPVLILLDPVIASYGVVANLLAAPAAPVATMVGLAGCLVLPLLPSVGYAALQLAALPAGWIALVAHGVSVLPAARVPWLEGAAGALLLAAGTAAALWLLLARPRPRAVRRLVAGALIVSIAVPAGVSIGAPLLRRAGAPEDWVVAACDIGQGDAVLVRDAGAVALIDTGPDEGALARCLDLTGVDRIDLLVLTHWDADHVAAVAAVAGRVSTVLHGPLDGARSTRALRPLIEGGAESHEVVVGARGSLGGASWRVLWPPPDEPPGNDASVVLDVRTSGFRGVFLGDLGEGAQTRLLREARPGGADLVKVAHHGSADQSAALYAELRADLGIIGVGADNGYGHPTRQLLDLLEETRTPVVRTDRSGTALFTIDDGGFRLWAEHAANRPSPAAAEPAVRRPYCRAAALGGLAPWAVVGRRLEWGDPERKAGPGSGGQSLRFGLGDEVAHGADEPVPHTRRVGRRELGTGQQLPAGVGRSDEAADVTVERDAVGGRIDRRDGRLRCEAEARVRAEVDRRVRRADVGGLSRQRHRSSGSRRPGRDSAGALPVYRSASFPFQSRGGS